MQHQSWLRLLAREALHQRLASKFDPSDVVQQTLLSAWKDWEQMRATDDGQRRAWLRAILAHQLAKINRQYAGTQRRDVRREQHILQSIDQSAARLEHLLVAREPTPSQAVLADEQRQRLFECLDKLSDDHRHVLILRNIDELSHQEIAQRMNRSEAAVRMLWLRALAALSAVLQE